MVSTVTLPTARLTVRAKRRPTIRDILNKKQGSIRKDRLKDFRAKKSKGQKQAGQEAEKPDVPTEYLKSDIEMFEFFRIKPETFNPDAKAMWKELWDETELEAQESGDDVDFSTLQQFCTREGGMMYYIDMDPAATEHELQMAAFVNMAYLLYRSDPDSLKEAWEEVEQIYNSRKELAMGALMAVEAGVDSDELVPMATGVRGERRVVRAGGQPIPEWGSKGNVEAVVVSCGLCLKSLILAAAGTKVGVITAAALTPLLASAGVPAAAATAIVGGLATGASVATSYFGAKLLTVMTKTVAGLTSNAIDALVFSSSQQMLTDYTTYNVVYREASESQIRSMAEFVTTPRYVGSEAAAAANYLDVYPNGPFQPDVDKTMELFKEYHFKLTPDSTPDVRGTVNARVMAPDVLERKVIAKLKNGGMSQETALNTAKRAREANRLADAASAGERQSALFKKYALIGVAQLGLGVLQMRKIKELSSIDWIKTVLETDEEGHPTQPAGVNPYTELYFWTQFDAQLHFWNCEYVCNTRNEKIQAYLDAEKGEQPPRGILKAEVHDANVDGHVAEAFKSDNGMLVQAYCTSTPAEERQAVIQRFEGLLKEIKTLLKDYDDNPDLIRQNTWGEVFSYDRLTDPLNWFYVPLKEVMAKLSPLVELWDKEATRLIVRRFARTNIRGYVEQPITPEEHLNLVQNDPYCARCMTQAEIKALKEEIKQAKAAETRRQTQAARARDAEIARGEAPTQAAERAEARRAGIAAGKALAARLLEDDPTINAADLEGRVAEAAAQAAVQYEAVNGREAQAIGKEAAKIVAKEREAAQKAAAAAQARQQREEDNEMRVAQRRADQRRQRAQEADMQRAEAGPRGEKLGAAEQAGKREGYRVTRLEMRKRRARPITSENLVRLVVRAVDAKAKEVYEATAQDEMEEEIPPADLRRITTAAKRRAEKMYTRFIGDPSEMPESVEQADRILAARGQANLANQGGDAGGDVDEEAEVFADQDDVDNFFAAVGPLEGAQGASVVDDVFARLAL